MCSGGACMYLLKLYKDIFGEITEYFHSNVR